MYLPLRSKRRFDRPALLPALISAGLLAGCVAYPPVVVPGPGKTEAAFQQDDAACRAAIAKAPPPAPQAPGPDPYAQCMVGRGNVLGPPPPPPPVVYAYPAYPAYPYDDPWLYGGPVVIGGWGWGGGHYWRR